MTMVSSMSNHALMTELEAVNSRWVAAMAAGDANAAVAQFASDGVIVASDLIVTRGVAELSDLFHTWIDEGFVNQTYTNCRAERLGEAAFMVSIHKTTICNDDGSISRERGKNAQVFVKGADDAWRIQLLDIAEQSL